MRRSGVALTEVPVIELEPVGAKEALNYLAHTNARWKTIAQQLKPTGDPVLAEALATPLMISLAESLYQGSRRDPAELLNRDQFPDAGAIESHLLEGIITASFPHDLPHARHSLTQLAQFLDRQQTRDFAWWQLRHAAQAPHVIAALVVGAVSWFAMGTAADHMTWLTGSMDLAGPAAGIGFGSLYLLLGRVGTHRPDHSPGPDAGPITIMANAVLTGMLGGLVMGLAAGLIAGLVGTAGAALAFGAGWGLAYGVLCGDRQRTAPIRNVVNGLVSGLIAWAVAALVIGFPYAEMGGYIEQLPGGPVDGSLQALYAGFLFSSPVQLGLGLWTGLVLGLTAGVVATFISVAYPRYGRRSSIPAVLLDRRRRCRRSRSPVA